MSEAQEHDTYIQQQLRAVEPDPRQEPLPLPEPPNWLPHSYHEAYLQGYEIGYKNGWHGIAPEASAAMRTLERLGFTYHGGQQWKPPLGPMRAMPLDFGTLVDTVYSGMVKHANWRQHKGFDVDYMRCVQYGLREAIKRGLINGPIPELGLEHD